MKIIKIFTEAKTKTLIGCSFMPFLYFIKAERKTKTKTARKSFLNVDVAQATETGAQAKSNERQTTVAIICQM